jgi:6,7-dimethyl-8-ribityllumazine synthase
MTEREQAPRVPQDTPEWTGDDPPDGWPVRQPQLPDDADPRAVQDADRGASHDADSPAVHDLPPGAPDDELDRVPVPPRTVEPDDERDDEPELPPAPESIAEPDVEDEDELAERAAAEHAAGEVDVPNGYTVIEGYPSGHRRTVAVVVGRFNGEITNRMLSSALEELEAVGVPRESVTVMPVPGAFELPLGAMALAKTRRFSCVVALGCVIRGETPHFEYVAGEAASGLQLAAIETGVPVAFGVLTCETVEQAEARVGKGGEAVRTALEMADVFAQVRASARA